MEMIPDSTMGAMIKIIGVGGGGGNAVQNMVNAKLEGVSFICANTDAQALADSLAEVHIQLGKELTQGLGAGGRPEVGQSAAEESAEEIREAICDAKMVFITAGMGGGTGTGAAPVIAKIAKENDILTVGVVTKPFKFEGAKRMKAALKGIEELRQHVDSLVIIPNERLLAIAPKKATVAEMFKKADDVLYDTVRGITKFITIPGQINGDFSDVRAVMSYQGMALMGEGHASGEDRALDAARLAITSPLLEDLSIAGCKAMLVNVTTNGNLGIEEFAAIGNFIEEASHAPDEEGPDIKIAMSVDESCGDELRITLIATGIEPEAAKKNTDNGKGVIVDGQGDQQTVTPDGGNRGGRRHIAEDILRRLGRNKEEPNDNAELPTYLQYPNKAKTTQGSGDNFIFEDEDSPSFLRRQTH